MNANGAESIAFPSPATAAAASAALVALDVGVDRTRLDAGCWNGSNDSADGPGMANGATDREVGRMRLMPVVLLFANDPISDDRGRSSNAVACDSGDDTRFNESMIRFCAALLIALPRGDWEGTMRRFVGGADSPLPLPPLPLLPPPLADASRSTDRPRFRADDGLVVSLPPYEMEPLWNGDCDCLEDTESMLVLFPAAPRPGVLLLEVFRGDGAIPKDRREDTDRTLVLPVPGRRWDDDGRVEVDPCVCSRPRRGLASLRRVLLFPVDGAEAGAPPVVLFWSAPAALTTSPSKDDTNALRSPGLIAASNCLASTGDSIPPAAAAAAAPDACAGVETCCCCCCCCCCGGDGAATAAAAAAAARARDGGGGAAGSSTSSASCS